ncbi:hypothetical protein GUJ93_ZPchr0012g18863 [Zizania palustris]|uniref:Uncharacterized protein n=1 Tax=Zizania palustris TaxID=103762 RepID=A0A8J5WH39_ZIZPA|nr:hypothetical protein GUJ93_ZPchr0012g18863 [Zizania palustris]
MDHTPREPNPRVNFQNQTEVLCPNPIFHRMATNTVPATGVHWRPGRLRERARYAAHRKWGVLVLGLAGLEVCGAEDLSSAFDPDPGAAVIWDGWCIYNVLVG